MVVFFWRYWAGNSVTSSTFINATFIGIAVGALYAMYATGLVVVYTTTGIFNFAQGAIGVFCAFLFWELHVNRGWHTLLALFFVVIIFAPTLGIVLDVILMRQLRTAPLVVQLMATVALMVLFLSLAGEIWEQDTIRRVDFFFGLRSGIEIFGVNILWHRLITILTAIALALGLSLLLFKSRLGVAMRAVVDNRDLAALNGVRPGLVSSSAWAIGCSLAALGGILIAPEVELDPANLNIIIITAFAAATFGALRSLPLTVVGALIIGLLGQHVKTWLDLGTDLRFAAEAVAPVVLFIVVLALPRAQLTVGRIATNLKQRERLTKTLGSRFRLGGADLPSTGFQQRLAQFRLLGSGRVGQCSAQQHKCHDGASHRRAFSGAIDRVGRSDQLRSAGLCGLWGILVFETCRRRRDDKRLLDPLGGSAGCAFGCSGSYSC